MCQSRRRSLELQGSHFCCTLRGTRTTRRLKPDPPKERASSNYYSSTTSSLCLNVAQSSTKKKNSIKQAKYKCDFLFCFSSAKEEFDWNTKEQPSTYEELRHMWLSSRDLLFLFFCFWDLLHKLKTMRFPCFLNCHTKGGVTQNGSI